MFLELAAAAAAAAAGADSASSKQEEEDPQHPRAWSQPQLHQRACQALTRLLRLRLPARRHQQLPSVLSSWQGRWGQQALAPALVHRRFQCAAKAQVPAAAREALQQCSPHLHLHARLALLRGRERCCICRPGCCASCQRQQSSRCGAQWPARACCRCTRQCSSSSSSSSSSSIGCTAAGGCSSQCLGGPSGGSGSFCCSGRGGG
jgi:hypothetical protein